MTQPSSWKKIFLSLLLIGASVAYVLYLNFGSEDEFSATNTPPKNTTADPATKTASAPTKTPATTSTIGIFTDGTYTGTAADAYYGTVQVRASISGGALTDIAFLQYPNDRTTSSRISAEAMPILKSEALQAQSANVDTVSGATEFSIAFRQSLATALAQARK